MRKFSVIVPIYNVSAFINECIQSVLSQDYGNFELILVNDGSTDDSGEIAERYAAQDSRIRVVHQLNAGLSGARNTGLLYATGEFVVFLDGDDSWRVDLLSKIDNTLNLHDADITVFGYTLDKYDERGLIRSSQPYIEAGRYIDKAKKENLTIYQPNLLGYAWNKVYRTELIINSGLRFENGTSYIEDCLFNERIFISAETIAFLDEALYHYRQRRDATLGKEYYANIDTLDIRANESFCSIMKSIGVSQKEVRAFSQQNTFMRARWTAGIVANTNKTDLVTKLAKLKAIISNANNVGIPDQADARSRVYAYIFRSNKPLLLLIMENLKSGNVRRLVLDILPQHIKELIVYISSKDDSYQYLQKHQKKIFIMLAADYGNLGDVAITYAQHRFLELNFPDYQVIDVPISKTYKVMKLLKTKTTKEDIITLVGGGNMGDLYLVIERQRRFVIKSFPHNKIISFPQTIDFSNTARGDKELKKSVRRYSRHKRLTLFSREEKSYGAMKRHFPKNTVLLSPDIVLSLDIPTKHTRSSDKVTMCIRDDAEVASPGGIRPLIEPTLKAMGANVVIRDTHIGDVRLNDERSIEELNKIWGEFQGSKLVVTDRLHGMIFSVITRTPCVAINNRNGKVFGVYDKWIRGTSYVSIVEQVNTRQVERSIAKLESVVELTRRDLSADFDNMRDEIKSS